MSEPSSTPSDSPITRRDFIKRSAGVAGLPALTAAVGSSELPEERLPKKNRPNIIVIISDQFRWDALGSYGVNSMHLTPNLDSMAKRGTMFRSHIANQPVCGPSRANLFTGQYQNRNGVWQNGIGLARDAVTLATVLRQAGYTTNYIGKWNLAPITHHKNQTLGQGAVPREYRGGFLDFWETSNQTETTSRPYEGDLWDAQEKAIHYSGVYRADFFTQRAIRFLDGFAHEPFLLVISYLEPHFQLPSYRSVAPKGYAERYSNPFVPEDLRFFPGDWQAQLPAYYGCVARIDESVGSILKTLRRFGIEDNTIVAFLSDHGCHFRTRGPGYKRTAHESSIHIPLVIQGPGFDRSMTISELTSQIDVTPTLLDAVGVPVPATIQGRSILPLLDRKTEGWPNEVYIQITFYQIGRALRTPEWTYAVAAPLHSDHANAPSSPRYEEYQVYNLFDDPHELVNLAGRRDDPSHVVASARHYVHSDGGHLIRNIRSHLRERLLTRMVEAGEEKAEIAPRFLYP